MKRKNFSIKSSPLKVKLANEINKTRKEMHLTIAQIAKYLEVSTANAGKYSNADVESPPYRVIACLAHLQGRKVSELVKDIEDENSHEHIYIDDFMDVINFLRNDLKDDISILLNMIRRKSVVHTDIKFNLKSILRTTRYLLMLDYTNLIKKEDEIHIFVNLLLMANKALDPADADELDYSKRIIIEEHKKMLQMN